MFVKNDEILEGFKFLIKILLLTNVLNGRVDHLIVLFYNSFQIEFKFIIKLNA